MNLPKSVSLTILLLALGFAGMAAAASFDCAKAASPAEKAICADPELSAADEGLAEFYDQLVWLNVNDKAVLRQLAVEQKDWLQKQRNACQNNYCYRGAYSRRQAAIRAQIQNLTEAKPAVAGRAELDAPLGGWRNSSGERMRYVQKVTYPASDVNAEDEHGSMSVIKGRIAVSPKSLGEREQPLALVVNGVPMPLKTNLGEFQRPYAFGPGSNSVEILAPDGRSLARTQFYEAYREKTSPKLRVVLSWDSDGTDLDLHVVTPDGGHCFYGNRALPNGGALDVDVTTGYGPEIFSMPTVLTGVHQVYVNYYGGGYESADSITIARVTVIEGEGTPDEKMETVSVPLRHPGELILVRTFSYP